MGIVSRELLELALPLEGQQQTRERDWDREQVVKKLS